MTPQITIYTDGAAQGNPGRGGYGVVLLSPPYRKELSEGFRLTDLKRWNVGMDRGNNSQNDDLTYMPGAATSTGLSVAAGDYRFTWPIPQSEIDTNPQIKGQQNPGY